jgi:pSer/pThr/pTyr-binding forkhead associated (FHA) protein
MRHSSTKSLPRAADDGEWEEKTAQVSLKIKPPRERPRRAHLLILKKGDGAPARVELNGDAMVIGRAQDVDIPIDSEQVSRQHARFVRIDDEYQVEDLASRNGVYLSGLKVHVALLREGDELQIGNVVFTYQEGT